MSIFNLWKEKVDTLQFSYQEIKEVISCLGFAIEEADDETLVVDIPSYRSDITLEVDLIEEVARLKPTCF